MCLDDGWGRKLHAGNVGLAHGSPGYRSRSAGGWTEGLSAGWRRPLSKVSLVFGNSSELTDGFAASQADLEAGLQGTAAGNDPKMGFRLVA